MRMDVDAIIIELIVPPHRYSFGVAQKSTSRGGSKISCFYCLSVYIVLSLCLLFLFFMDLESGINAFIHSFILAMPGALPDPRWLRLAKSQKSLKCNENPNIVCQAFAHFSILTLVPPIAISAERTQGPWPVTLSWPHRYICKMTYKPSKLGQTNLLFGLWSEFIIRSVHAWLQVYVRLWFVPTWLTHRQTHRETAVLLAQPVELSTAKDRLRMMRRWNQRKSPQIWKIYWARSMSDVYKSHGSYYTRLRCFLTDSFTLVSDIYDMVLCRLLV